MFVPMGKSAIILICDDEAPIRCVVGAKLRAGGHTVLEAADGDEGLAVALRDRPTLIVTDFQMPGRSGMDLALELRRRPETASTPIIMLTARGHSVDASQLPSTNIVARMAKPFSARDLARLIEETLASRSTPAKAA